MWRSISVHKQSETEFLDAALERVEHDAELRERADALLQSVAENEPLFADVLRTPQSPHYHAEGPFVEDHLRLMLMSLYAVQEEKLHLIDIEEFRRMKGYEGEIDELEELLKEQISLFEVFTLCHDVGKWPTLGFESAEGSRGAGLGFNSKPDHGWEPFAATERAKLRDRYLDLYHTFADQHPTESDRDVQAQFFLAYGIRTHYPGHERIIHTPVYQQLLERLGYAHRLTKRDLELLEDLIAHHLEPIYKFKQENPSAARQLIGFAQARNYDADDFLDLLQGCVFLDAVCGSMRRTAHGLWHDPTPIVHFLRSEHLAMPSRRKEKIDAREAAREKRRKQIFRKVGLDGVALLELFNMEPGPDFGRALRRVQAAVAGKGRMPHFSPGIDQEIAHRAGEYYREWFTIGEEYDD